MPFDLLFRCVDCGRLKTLPREAFIYSEDFGGFVCGEKSCGNMMPTDFMFFDLINWQGACCLLENWRFVRAEFDKPPIIAKHGSLHVKGKLKPFALESFVYSCPMCAKEKTISLSAFDDIGPLRFGSLFVCDSCDFDIPSEIRLHKEIIEAGLRFNDWMKMVSQWFEVFPAELAAKFPDRSAGVRNARKKRISANRDDEDIVAP